MKKASTPILSSRQDQKNELSLDGSWKMLLDPAGFGESWGAYQMAELPHAHFTGARKALNYRPVTVPGTYTGLPEMKWYREKVWYFKRFAWRPAASERVFLRFEAVNYHARVWLNGRLLGEHEGGYTPFEFEIDRSALARQNYLAVRVDPVPGPDSTVPVPGWMCHPGIIRSVTLYTTPLVRLTETRITAVLNDDFECGRVNLESKLDGKLSLKATAKLTIRDTDGSPLAACRVPVKDGKLQVSLDLKNIRVWSPESPCLYAAELELACAGRKQLYTSRLGFRRFEIRREGFYLNGHKYFIHGVGLHAMHPGLGHTIPAEIYARDYAMMKRAGLNAVRLVHYPHDVRALDLADEMGLLVWEEIPLYWKANKSQACTRQSALSQLRDLILRDRNHPCIFVWGLGNEIPTSDPDSVSFFRQARKLAAKLDPVRPCSFINNRVLPEAVNAAMQYADFIACNVYKGWYDLKLNSMPETLDIIAKKFPDRPILITEFGAGAVYGRHGSAKVPWTEEYQARVIKANIEYFRKHPRVGGYFIWCWADFDDPTRLDNIYERGVNNKGILDASRHPKAAYKMLEDARR